MKRIIFVILFTSACSFSKLQACDICGCGVNNYYIGILPQFNHTFFGTRYYFSSYNTRLTADPTQFSKDFYQSIELWGGWNIGKKFQVLAFVPYNFNHQYSDEGVINTKGLGDITLLGSYKLFDIRSVTTGSKVISQQLWIGGGIKFPTGKFNLESTAQDVASIANGQLGSGSIDFLLHAMYNIRINRLGFNSAASYKINSANRDQYKFGDKLLLSSIAFYSLPSSKITINPNVGLLYEHTGTSELQAGKIALTGGSILNGSAGIEMSFKKMAIGFNVQLPVTQNFAQGQTKENIKGMVHVSFAI